MRKTLKAALALALCVTMLLSSAVSGSALLLDKGGIYVADFDTREDALAAADEVIIPCSAAYLPVKGLHQLISTLVKVKKRLNKKTITTTMSITMTTTIITMMTIANN